MYISFIAKNINIFKALFYMVKAVNELSKK